QLKTPATKQSGGKKRVEFLYFKSCPNRGEALANLKAALSEAGIEAGLVLVEVLNEAQAAPGGFQGSPSIRVNGKDLAGLEEAPSFSCRAYQIDGRMTFTPSKDFIKQRLKELTR